ncbi:MAG: four helix bundle protein [Planctomycetaceae bacterium]
MGSRGQSMRGQELRDRTKQFALRVIRMYVALPKTTEAQVIGKQVLRSGTSVAANFREATRARSDAEFISKLGIVEQELDETALWMELLVESEIVSENRLRPLIQETDELLRIIVSTIKTKKSNTSRH